MESELEDLAEDFDSIYLHLCDEHPELDDEEIDKLAEKEFSSHHGQSYTAARNAIEAKHTEGKE